MSNRNSEDGTVETRQEKLNVFKQTTVGAALGASSALGIVSLAPKDKVQNVLPEAFDNAASVLQNIVAPRPSEEVDRNETPMSRKQTLLLSAVTGGFAGGVAGAKNARRQNNAKLENGTRPEDTKWQDRLDKEAQEPETGRSV